MYYQIRMREINGSKEKNGINSTFYNDINIPILTYLPNFK